jgi:hypothetical protein
MRHSWAAVITLISGRPTSVIRSTLTLTLQPGAFRRARCSSEGIPVPKIRRRFASERSTCSSRVRPGGARSTAPIAGLACTAFGPPTVDMIEVRLRTPSGMPRRVTDVM